MKCTFPGSQRLWTLLSYLLDQQLIPYHKSSFLISAPSLGVYYCQQLSLFVCPSVCLSHPFKLLLFCFSMESSHFFGCQFSMTPSTKCCSSIFDLGPLTPKIYSPKFKKKIAYKSACMADRQEMFGPTRGFSGMSDSMEPCKMLWYRPLLPWQRNLGLCFSSCFSFWSPTRTIMSPSKLFMG